MMVAATTALVIVTVLLTVFAGPLFELADRAAANLIDPDVLRVARVPRRHPMTRPELEVSRWRSVWRQLPLLVALVALWLFLWDHIDALTIVTGVLLAIAVTRVLYLPPVLLSGRFNPWRGLLLGLRMMFDVMVASVQVAFLAINPRWQPMNSIIAVQLLTRSDLVTTLTAEAISVVPGTVVVDIDRERGLLYLHALGTRTPADIDRMRRDVLGTEERIVLAIGTGEQAASVREARACRGRAEVADEGGPPMTFLTVVGIIAGIMFGIGALAAVYRIIRGPSILDRALATDVLLAIAICALGAEMAINAHTDTLVVMLVLAMFAVVGSIAIARFMAKQDAS